MEPWLLLCRKCLRSSFNYWPSNNCRSFFNPFEVVEENTVSLNDLSPVVRLIFKKLMKTDIKSKVKGLEELLAWMSDAFDNEEYAIFQKQYVILIFRFLKHLGYSFLRNIPQPGKRNPTTWTEDSKCNNFTRQEAPRWNYWRDFVLMVGLDRGLVTASLCAGQKLPRY